MKKTFRRVLASMLAVLMVLCAMPFTAFATQANRQWWTEEELPLTEEPTYWGYNSPQDETYQPAGSWDLNFGDTVELELSGDYEDHRDDYKPIFAVTVSSQGQNGMPAADLKSTYYNKYYGQSSGRTYDQVKSDGLLLNPAELKAGQRIAVALEFGGFDILSSGQFKGKFDTAYLKPAYYKSAIRNSDTWTDIPGSDAAGFISDGSEYYAKALSFAGANINANRGTFYLAVTSKNFTNGQLVKSNFIGTGLADETGARSFGKYGIYSGTMSFEVLQDCDLSEVLTFDEGFGGTAFQPVHEDNEVVKADGLKYITINDTDVTFAKFAPVIWSEYKGTEPRPEDHRHTYTVQHVDATCEEDAKDIYTCDNSDGKGEVGDDSYEEIDNDTALGHDYTSPECVVTPNNDGAKHTVKCLRYDQCNTTSEVECTSVPDTDKNKEASSCTPDGGGWEGATKCEVCGQQLNAGQATAPKSHTEVPDTDKNKAATCTDPGWKDATKCDVCGETINEGQEIPALNHEYTGEVIKGTDGEHHTVKCVRYDQCGSTQEVACTWDQTDEGTDPTYDTPGKQPTYTCNVCGQTKGGETIPALEGISVTVTAEDLGTSTINGSEVTDADVTVKVAPNSEVTLKATPKDGAKFVAWTVNGKVVSTEAEHTFTALTNITFEPVFQDAEEETFTVVFADMYGNIYNTQTVSSGTEIEVPDGPVIAGYTFSGWSLTDEEIDALTEATTIVAKYERDTTQTFTVTATGATITTPYSTTQNTNTGIGYNTKVTVTAEGAKAWKINGVIVAYGETYEFYIGSDIELTAIYDSVTATPVVAAVSVTEIGTEGALKASFLASRQMTEDTTYIRAGFVYAVNPENESLTLADVDETTVRAYYCSTASEQFALNVGRQDQTGKIVARAFLAYSDSDGATKVIYAEPQSYTYD